MTEGHSDEKFIDCGYKDVISYYQEMEEELKEFRRVDNIQRVAYAGAILSLVTLFTIFSRNRGLGKEDLLPVLANLITQFESIVDYLDTIVTPLIDSIPLSLPLVVFTVSFYILFIFEKERSELSVNYEDLFKSKVASAAVILTEESPEEAANELRSAIKYRSAEYVLPYHKIIQTEEFLRNFDEIEDEEEAREKIATVLSDLMDNFEEESKIASINRELEGNAAAEQSKKSHVDTFIKVIEEKILSEPRQFDLIVSSGIVVIFFVDNQFALLLAGLFGAIRLHGHFE